MSEWIKCSDRMPLEPESDWNEGGLNSTYESQELLITDGYNIFLSKYKWDNCNKRSWWSILANPNTSNGSNNIIFQITHWMPIPIPEVPK